LRGKLIKKIARPKWFSHIPTKNEIKLVTKTRDLIKTE
jgi:hypothetical protein